MTFIKICGMTRSEDALLAAELGVDAIGFIFTKSPRQISISQAATINAALPSAKPLRVGVFVDQPIAFVREAIDACHLDMVQLNGNEPPSYCAELNAPYIRVLHPKTEADLEQLKQFMPDFFILDTAVPGLPGGTGKTFNWELAKIAKTVTAKPVIVAGGLTPENVGTLLKAVDPFGVDVASGIEKEPGKKDHARLRAFVLAVREGV